MGKSVLLSMMQSKICIRVNNKIEYIALMNRLNENGIDWNEKSKVNTLTRIMTDDYNVCIFYYLNDNKITYGLNVDMYKIDYSVNEFLLIPFPTFDILK
jgi:hypothetical protein